MSVSEIRARNFSIFVAALLCGSCLQSRIQASTVDVSSWTPLYQGIDYATGTISGNDASVAYALRVDLTAPGVSLFTTPGGGSLNTVSETTSQFVEKTGVQVAINANFFAPCCNAFPEDKTVIGLAVSNGSVVAPPTTGGGNSNAALLISRQNVASIVTTTASMNLSNVYNAVAGSAIIVQNGTNIGAQSPNEGDPTNPNPRTDLGVSQSGQYLYLVAIDGRQAGYSIGTTIPETADIMLAFGAYNAINLDGGGSTAMVQSDGRGGAFDLNRPSGGTERFDANDLGVFALPLPTPEPGTAALLGLTSVAAGIVYRRRRFR